MANASRCGIGIVCMYSLSVMSPTITHRLLNVNNHLGITRTVNTCLNSGVNVYAIRQRNLAALVESMFAGNQAKLASAIGAKQPQVNRWLSTSTASPRKISEESARQIEAKLGLRENGLDDPNGCVSDGAAQPNPVFDDVRWILEHGRPNEISIFMATIEAIKSAHKNQDVKHFVTEDRRKRA